MQVHTHEYPIFTEKQENMSIFMELMLCDLAAQQAHFIKVVTKRLAPSRINLINTN